MKRNARGMSASEVIVLVVVVGTLIGLAALALPGLFPPRRHGGGRQIKDAVQLKNVAAAMHMFALQNKNAYPQPSVLDKDHATLLTHDGEEFKKDTTGNLLSILIWNGSIFPEIACSTAEASGVIRVDDLYQTSNPTAAANPAKALWDPAFAGTPGQVATVGTAAARAIGLGNNSFAHAPLHGDRLGQWMLNFSSTQAILGNRGPGYTLDVTANPRWRLNAAGASPPGVDSVTLLIHGGRKTWEGNIAYNDARVNFETRPDPVEITYIVQDPSGPPGTSNTTQPDNLFVNEADDASRTSAGQVGGTNVWLVMITGVSGSAESPELKLFHD